MVGVVTGRKGERVADAERRPRWWPSSRRCNPRPPSRRPWSASAPRSASASRAGDQAAVRTRAGRPARHLALNPAPGHHHARAIGAPTSVRGRGGGDLRGAGAAARRGQPDRPRRDDRRDVLDLRAAIEVGAATLAADRASETDLATAQCVTAWPPPRVSTTTAAWTSASTRDRRGERRAAADRARGRGRGRRLRADRAHRPPARGARPLKRRARADDRRPRAPRRDARGGLLVATWTAPLHILGGLFPPGHA